jgi:two-component system, NarL family, response regulator NreC
MSMPPYRIVLADDHLLLREAIKKSIEEIPDFQVVGEAGDGLELLKLLEKLVPDLILLDISMPRFNGMQAAGSIKKTYPHVKILILTMIKSRESIQRALQIGVNGYLLKENAFSDLISAIRAIQQGKTYLSPLITDQIAQVMVDMGNMKSPLTKREVEILGLLSEGKSSQEIANLLFISVHTVNCHRSNIRRKLNLRKTVDLVKYAIQKEHAFLDVD